MPGIFEAAALLLGLLLGSFLNVVIYRLPRGESVVQPRSRCPSCGEPIRASDNVPVLSWLLLRGRCRGCHAPISWRYPAVELAAGLWCLLVAEMAAGQFGRMHAAGGANLGDPDAILLIGAVGTATLGLFLLPLIVIDWEHQLLPDWLTFPGMLAGLLLVCSRAIFLGPTEGQIHLRRNPRISSPGSVSAHGTLFLTGPEAMIFGRVAAVVGVVALLLAIRWIYRRLRQREGMGLGDVKLLAMIAAFLGFWPAVLALFLGVLLGTLYAVPLLARGRANALTRLPFGSFLGVGGMISGVFGTAILSWYQTLL